MCVRCAAVIHLSRTRAVLRCALRRVLRSAFISFHFISFHFISFHFISFHFISFHFISFHFISFHFISLHFISFHFISVNHQSIINQSSSLNHSSTQALKHSSIQSSNKQQASNIYSINHSLNQSNVVLTRSVHTQDSTTRNSNVCAVQLSPLSYSCVRPQGLLSLLPRSSSCLSCYIRVTACVLPLFFSVDVFLGERYITPAYGRGSTWQSYPKK